MTYTEYPIVWNGISIAVRFCPSYSKVVDVYHIELQSEKRVPMPVSETGYRSHFVLGKPPENILEEVIAWLDEQGSKPHWKAVWKDLQKEVLMQKQLSLF